MNTADRTLLFVYGTLKRRGSNHSRLSGQTFLGPARTVPGYTLYSLGEYPGLVPDPADLAGVAGELWAVDAPALDALDDFEGVAEGLYTRIPAPLATWPATLTPELARHAWMYLYARDLSGRPRIGAEWPV